jgi:hypothetical protein
MGRGAGRWFGERKLRFWLISGSWKLARDEGRFTSGDCVGSVSKGKDKKREGKKRPYRWLYINIVVRTTTRRPPRQIGRGRE